MDTNIPVQCFLESLFRINIVSVAGADFTAQQKKSGDYGHSMQKRRTVKFYVKITVKKYMYNLTPA